jgi:hypothetical protein
LPLLSTGNDLDSSDEAAAKMVLSVDRIAQLWPPPGDEPNVVVVGDVEAQLVDVDRWPVAD